MASLQEWIYKMEQGSGARYLKIITATLLILTLALLYNFRAYRNFDTQEAMDAAQLAHNLADGKGYTTLFIRPLSIYLLQSHAEAGSTNVLAATNPGFGAPQNRASRIWPIRRCIRSCWRD